MTKEKKDSNKDNTLVVFKPSIEVTEYQVILEKGTDTLWATELQIAEIFGREKTVINRHIKNSFKEVKLDEVSTKLEKESIIFSSVL